MVEFTSEALSSCWLNFITGNWFVHIFLPIQSWEIVHFWECIFLLGCIFYWHIIVHNNLCLILVSGWWWSDRMSLGVFLPLQLFWRICELGINPIWLWCMIFFMCCWIGLLIFCWEFLHLYSSKILACNFLVWF